VRHDVHDLKGLRLSIAANDRDDDVTIGQHAHHRAVRTACDGFDHDEHTHVFFSH
jgi:hypothetical protein